MREVKKPGTITLRQIETFTAIVQTSSVTAAAKSMNVSQPSVSRLLSSLEQNIGFNLFERHKRRLLPTPEAILLYEEVQRYFRNLQRLANTAADIRALARGQLRLGSFIALSISVTPTVIKKFHEAYPQISISCTTMQSRQIVDLVSSRFVDLGIIDPIAVTDDARIEQRWRFRCVCALPAGHHLAENASISAAQLAKENVIGLEGEFFSRSAAGAELYALLAPKLLIQVHQSIAACMLVSEGIGVAIVDPFTAMHCESKGIVVRRLDVTIPFDLCITSSPEARLSIASKAFLNIFNDEIERVCKVSDYIERCA
jgi:DNA-binding transcriptional LysR family regulator